MLLSSQHPSEEEKPRRNRTLRRTKSQRRENGAQISKTFFFFFCLQSVAKPGRLGWPIPAPRRSGGTPKAETSGRGMRWEPLSPGHSLGVKLMGTGSCRSAHIQRVARLTWDKQPCSGNQKYFQTQGFGLVDVHHLALVLHLLPAWGAAPGGTRARRRDQWWTWEWGSPTAGSLLLLGQGFPTHGLKIWGSVGYSGGAGPGDSSSQFGKVHFDTGKRCWLSSSLKPWHC